MHFVGYFRDIIKITIEDKQIMFEGGMKNIILILDNIVYMEFLRRGYVVIANKNMDIVYEDWENKQYIQVAYLLASEDSIKREFGVYDQVCKNFPKYVVALDEFAMNCNGMKSRNIWNFLTQKEWN